MRNRMIGAGAGEWLLAAAQPEQRADWTRWRNAADRQSIRRRLGGERQQVLPGLGPVVAAGWLASTALGAVAGGATGGVVGALTQAGVSDEEAPLYAEGVRRGGTLVSARVPDADRTRYEAILNQSAVNLRDRSAAWQKAGWKNYDPSAQPYGAEEVRRERQLYGTGLR